MNSRVRTVYRRAVPLSPILGGFFLSLVLLTACEKEESPTGSQLALNNCTSCHLDQARIVATAAPEDDGGGESPGEG